MLSIFFSKKNVLSFFTRHYFNFVMSFLGNLLRLGDGPKELNMSFMAVAALILEIVKIFMNYDLERLLCTENILCLTSYILCLI